MRRDPKAAAFLHSQLYCYQLCNIGKTNRAPFGPFTSITSVSRPAPPHQKTPESESQEFYFSSLVPETGLEPAHLMAYAPKAYVYTNFTTRAYLNYSTKKPRTLVSASLRVTYSKTPWRFFITRVVM